MGSLKKKLTKVLRKITPKEIAPALPIAAMFIPGMQGLAPLWKFALPQLMTAAGSARTSGKISGLNQALAGIGSLAGINASNQALQQAATGPTSQLGTAGALKPTAAGTGLTASAQEAAAQLAKNQGMLSSAASAMGNAPIIGGTFNTLGQGMTNLSSLLPGGASPQFGWNMAAPLAMGAGMAATDAAELDKVEAAEQAAARKDAYRNYLDQISNLTAYYGNLGPLNQQFGPWNYITAKEGGRVGKNWGGILGALGNFFGGDPEDMPASDNDPYRMSPEEESNWNELKNFMTLMKAREIDMVPSEVMDLSGVNLSEGVDRELMQQRIEAWLNPNAKGGRIKYAGGDMVGGLGALHPMNPAPSAVAPNMPKGMQVDGRNGTFIPMGAKEKHDDVPAMLAKNEFVMTSDAVKGMGNGDVNVGAQRMYDLMNNLEANV